MKMEISQETTSIDEFIAIKKKEPLCRVDKSKLVQPSQKTMNALQKKINKKPAFSFVDFCYGLFCFFCIYFCPNF